MSEDAVRGHRFDWLVGSVLLVAAAALRIPGAITHAFDQDELYTYFESRDLFSTSLEPGIEARPLYYLIQHPLLEVLPMSEIGLRVLPLLFGLAGVLSTWWIAKRISGSSSALVAGAVVTVAPWHIYVSQTARYWSLVYLVAAWFIYTLWEGARQSGKEHWYIYSLALLILGTATHPTFVFPAIGALLLTVATMVGGSGPRPWDAVRPLIVRVVLPFLLFGVLVFGLLSILGQEESIRNFDGRGTAALLRLLPAIVEWVTPLMMASAVIAAASLLLQPQTRDMKLFGAASIGAIAGSIGALLAAALITDVYAYYATAMLPAVFLSIGAATSLLIQNAPHSPRGWLAGSIALILVIGVAPGTASQYTDGTRFDFRPAFQVIRSHGAADAVLAWPTVVHRYYAPDLEAQEFRPDTTYLRDVLDRADRVWMVVPRRRYGIVGDTDGMVRGWLGQNCDLVSTHLPLRFDFRMYEVQVHRCRVTGPSSRTSGGTQDD